MHLSFHTIQLWNGLYIEYGVDAILIKIVVVSGMKCFCHCGNSNYIWWAEKKWKQNTVFRMK